MAGGHKRLFEVDGTAISVKLAKIKSELGWSQMRLAKETGFNQSTISKYLRGMRQPEYKFLVRLVELGVDPAYLFYRDYANIFASNGLCCNALPGHALRQPKEGDR